MYVSGTVQSVRKQPGNEKSRIKHQRDKVFQPCKNFIVELLSRKGRPHPLVQTDKILLSVSLHTHVPTIQKFSSTYTHMKNKLTGLGPEKRQRRQSKMHRQSKRNIRAEDTNETISGLKQQGNTSCIRRHRTTPKKHYARQWCKL